MCITLYHYTDMEGAKGILQEDTIFKSTRQTAADAISGDGVYLTDKVPRFSKLAIAKDIFLDKTLPNRMVKHGRIDFAFKLVLRKSENLECVNRKNGIWLYRNHNLELKSPDVQYWELQKGPDREDDSQHDEEFWRYFDRVAAADYHLLYNNGTHFDNTTTA